VGGGSPSLQQRPGPKPAVGRRHLGHSPLSDPSVCHDRTLTWRPGGGAGKALGEEHLAQEAARLRLFASSV